jgi:ubiquinone/menaquinone biosynthesis C-methylase UbiE
MFGRFRKRSKELEHIDKGDYTPEEYEGCIIELKRVNRWMGDAWALAQSLLKSIERAGQEKVSVLDVGAGSGELLRITSSWARQHGRQIQLVGLELNERSAGAIMEDSPGEISAIRGDALHLPFADNTFDYVISSLFIHHFEDDQVVAILHEMNRVTRQQVLVIDLHRHPIAYLLYTTVGRIVLHTRLLREDGALSILRSFKPKEISKLAESAGLSKIHVFRSFPFRLVLRAEKESQMETSRGQSDQAEAERLRLAS